MALPPSLAGAVQLSVTLKRSPDPLSMVGALGVVAGVTAPDGVEPGPVPAPLMAATVKV
jgi:hypothetical protein